MAATLPKQSASATLDPPNLCTTQGSALVIYLGFLEERGVATLLKAMAFIKKASGRIARLAIGKGLA